MVVCSNELNPKARAPATTNERKLHRFLYHPFKYVCVLQKNLYDIFVAYVQGSLPYRFAGHWPPNQRPKRLIL
jgi:hypothetical protein